MPANIETDIAIIKVFDSAVEDPVLDEHVAQIRKLGKRIVEDVIEIGRRLTECKKILGQILGHGNWLPWLDQKFGWSEATARNFMRVYELTQSKSANFADLKLPVSALYLLAAPNAPEQARQEIVERAEAGENLTVSEVEKTIKRAKGKKSGVISNADTAAPSVLNPNGHGAESAEDSAERRRAQYAQDNADQDDHATHTGESAATRRGQHDHAASDDQVVPYRKHDDDNGVHWARPDEERLIREGEAAAVNQIVGEYFAKASIADIFDRLTSAQRLELFDLAICKYASAETPVPPTKSGKKLLENLNGTLRWALGQDDPASGGQAIKIMKAKLAANKHGADAICLTFVKKGKR
jgi:hypothetical protein